MKKTHANAVIPKFAKDGDAGLDLVAVSKSLEINEAGIELVVYRLGLAMEIPRGYVGLIFPRSSITKTGLSLANSVGVIDSGYRGEIVAKFIARDSDLSYEVGDRVCQIVFVAVPEIEIEEATELSDSERGVGGFGSTGNQ